MDDGYGGRGPRGSIFSARGGLVGDGTQPKRDHFTGISEKRDSTDKNFYLKKENRIKKHLNEILMEIEI